MGATMSGGDKSNADSSKPKIIHIVNICEACGWALQDPKSCRRCDQFGPLNYAFTTFHNNAVQKDVVDPSTEQVQYYEYHYRSTAPSAPESREGSPFRDFFAHDGSKIAESRRMSYDFDNERKAAASHIPKIANPSPRKMDMEAISPIRSPSRNASGSASPIQHYHDVVRQIHKADSNELKRRTAREGVMTPAAFVPQLTGPLTPGGSSRSRYAEKNPADLPVVNIDASEFPKPSSTRSMHDLFAKP